MMKQNGFGWKKDLGMARLLGNHYNVNYKVNLRMFLKVGGGEPLSLYWVPIHGPNGRNFPPS